MFTETLCLTLKSHLPSKPHWFLQLPRVLLPGLGQLWASCLPRCPWSTGGRHGAERNHLPPVLALWTSHKTGEYFRKHLHSLSIIDQMLRLILKTQIGFWSWMLTRQRRRLRWVLLDSAPGPGCWEHLWSYNQCICRVSGAHHTCMRRTSPFWN